MPNHQPTAKVLWTNQAAGTGTTLTADGDSGTDPIDIHDITDLALSVTTGDPSGTDPTLLVQIDMQDACGNWITQIAATASITDAGTTAVYTGLHASPGVVLTGECRIAWTVGGSDSPTFPGVGICLTGR